MPSETILIGGETGGKSTFLGGLLYYFDEISDHDHDIDFLYDRDFVINEVYDQMVNNRKYPPPTDEDDAYMLQIRVESGSLFPEVNTFEIMDFPGEYQFPSRPSDPLMDPIRHLNPLAKSEQQQVVDRYENDLQSKLENDESLTDNEWKEIFEYHYRRSDTAICMLNLHKLMNEEGESDPEIIDSKNEDILSVASGKSHKLVLVTACDVIGYDPDDFDGDGQSFLSGTVRDNQLAEEIENSVTLTEGNAVKNVLRKVRRNDSNFSFLGVSVAAEDPKQGNKIRSGLGAEAIDISGYENVVQWLMN